MKQKPWRNILIGAVLILGVSGLLLLWRLLAIDDCLDRGGVYWVKENKCEL